MVRSMVSIALANKTVVKCSGFYSWLLLMQLTDYFTFACVLLWQIPEFHVGICMCHMLVIIQQFPDSCLFCSVTTRCWNPLQRRGSGLHGNTAAPRLPCPPCQHPLSVVMLRLPWQPQGVTRLCWPQIVTPGWCWPRWTSCVSAQTSATWVWTSGAGSSGSTGLSSLPAARTSQPCSRGGWRRRTRTKCTSLEWTRSSLRVCWNLCTQVVIWITFFWGGEQTNKKHVKANIFSVFRSDQCNRGQRSGADGGRRHAAPEWGCFRLRGVP